jgi:hypothetical protein
VVVPGARSDEGVNSLDGEPVGGVAIGAAPPNEGGLALSSIGDDGAGRMMGGADLAGGVDCALTCSVDDTTSTVPRMMIGQSLTAYSPVLDRRPPS